MGTNSIDLAAILEEAVRVLAPGMAAAGAADCNAGDLDWEAWPQGWGSTALGYGGIGGQSMTGAQTVIVSSVYSHEVAVFFGGRRLAYIAHSDSPGYQKAYAKRQMPPCNRAATVRRPS